MNPEIWGPPAWLFIHSVTLIYPDKPSDDTKIKYKNFFENLEHVLPCGACRNNYSLHLKKMPLTNNILSSKKNLVKWLIDVHNEVNKINKKTEVTYEYFENKYNQLYAYPEQINYYKNMNHLLILLLIICIMIIVCMYLNNMHSK